MKKLRQCLLLLLCTLLLTSASAEPLGFGLVNTNRTNLRKSMGGDLAFRQNKGEYVYIYDHASDKKGQEWYHVWTDVTRDYTTRTRSGWVRAEYVTAGDELFQDVVQISAGDAGMLALHGDGTVTGVAHEVSDERVFQSTIAAWRDIRQVAAGSYTYFAVGTDGRLHGFGNADYEDWESVTGVSLLDVNSVTVVYIGTKEKGGAYTSFKRSNPRLSEPSDIRGLAAGNWWLVILLEDGTAVFQGKRAPSDCVDTMESWDNLIQVDVAHWYGPNEVARMDDASHAAFAGLHADGTVSVTPAEWFRGVEEWTDIKAISMAANVLLGLRQDGRVVAAGSNPYAQHGTDDWRDIVAISAARGYCVGLKNDGTLVWAGNYAE